MMPPPFARFRPTRGCLASRRVRGRGYFPLECCRSLSTPFRCTGRWSASFPGHFDAFAVRPRRAEAELQTHRSVREMKQTSGLYTEMEWIKSDNTQEENNHGPEHGVKLNSREWDENVQKVVASFNKPSAAKASAFGVRPRVAAFESADMSAHSKNAAADQYETLPVGKVSPLREDEVQYYAVAVTKKGKGRLKLATVAWLKEPLRSWLAKAETQVPVTMAAVSAN